MSFIYFLVFCYLFVGFITLIVGVIEMLEYKNIESITLIEFTRSLFFTIFCAPGYMFYILMSEITKSFLKRIKSA
jgi:hypothetical protein